MDKVRRLYPEEWEKMYDAAAPRHAVSAGMDLRCGIASGRDISQRRGDAAQCAFSITWLLTGNGAYTERVGDDERRYELYGGMLLLRRPGRPGALRLDKGVQRRCYIHMRPEFVSVVAATLPEIEDLPTVIEQPYNERLFMCFGEFISEAESTDATAPLRFADKLTALICALYNLRGGELDAPILKAARFIMNQPVSANLTDIAERCDIPYNMFRKRFKAAFGQTPGQWRIIERIERAKQELAAGESISSVSDRLGYADLYAFNHQFRNITGITPKQYQLNNIV